MGELHERLDKLSNDINKNITILQKLQKGEEAENINKLLLILNNNYNETNEKLISLYKINIPYTYNTYPNIFNMFIEGVDKNTLVHVLQTFEKYQSGLLSNKDALDNGVNYVSKYYNIPKELINKDTIDKLADSL